MPGNRRRGNNALAVCISLALICALGYFAARFADAPDATTSALTAAVQTPTAIQTDALPVRTTAPTANELPARTTAPTTNAQAATVLPTVTPDPSIAPTATPAPEAITITLTAAGDVTLGGTDTTRNRFDEIVQDKGNAYFLQNVADYFLEDDVTVVNFEGTLTNARSKASGRDFNFKGKPEYVQILVAGGVEMASLANNHAMDYREKGYKDTRKVLTDAGVDAFDAANPVIRAVKGVKLGCIGFYVKKTTAKKMDAAIRTLREQCDILVVFMHWGKESSHATTAEQRKCAYCAVEAGADLVLGSHTHVAGGVETYRGVDIVYSMGNFCFGGNTNPVDKGAYMFRHTFEYLPGTGIVSGASRVIPVTISSVSSTNNYQPTIATGAARDAILKDVRKNARNFEGELG